MIGAALYRSSLMPSRGLLSVAPVPPRICGGHETDEGGLEAVEPVVRHGRLPVSGLFWRCASDRGAGGSAVRRRLHLPPAPRSCTTRIAQNRTSRVVVVTSLTSTAQRAGPAFGGVGLSSGGRGPAEFAGPRVDVVGRDQVEIEFSLSGLDAHDIAKRESFLLTSIELLSTCGDRLITPRGVQLSELHEART